MQLTICINGAKVMAADPRTSVGIFNALTGVDAASKKEHEGYLAAFPGEGGEHPDYDDWVSLWWDGKQLRIAQISTRRGAPLRVEDLQLYERA